MFLLYFELNADISNVSKLIGNLFKLDEISDYEETFDDGKAYAGVMSRGSAGAGADSRAQGQLPDLKSDNPNFCNSVVILGNVSLNMSKTSPPILIIP